MKTRILWTKMWEDEWFDNLSDDARLLFIYLITNPFINLSGCYEVRDKTICYHTHLNQDQLNKAKEDLNPKVIFSDNWIYVVNSQGYGGYTGKDIEKALLKEIEFIPQNVKNTFGITKPYTPPTESLPHPYPSINHKSEIINKKSQIRNKKIEIINNKKYVLEGNMMREVEE